MIKELVHDPMLLGIKSKDAVKEDILVGRDLLDTLMAHRETCVGMAANMIGVTKRIIAFSDNGRYTVMYNPEIVSKSGMYQTEEGCLSLLGGPRPSKLHGIHRADHQARDRSLQRCIDIRVTVRQDTSSSLTVLLFLCYKQ